GRRADAVGDLLLCWHADPAVHSRRPRAQRVPGTEAAWHPLAHGADWTLWHLPLSAAMRAGPGWQGYDLWHGGTARWEVWLLTDWVPREVREAFDPTMQHGGAGDDDDDDAEPCVPDNGQF